MSFGLWEIEIEWMSGVGVKDSNDKLLDIPLTEIARVHAIWNTEYPI